MLKPFLQKAPKHEFNFHDDESLNQTPEGASLLSRLPREIAALAPLAAATILTGAKVRYVVRPLFHLS